MDNLNQPSQAVARRVRLFLLERLREARELTGSDVRAAARMAARGSLSMGRGAGNMARATIEGTVKAAAEIGGETTGFIRDAVIGVIEETEEVVTVTAPEVRDVVTGAIKARSDKVEELAAVSKEAVEGAIVGATAAGMNATEAATIAVDAAIDAVMEAGGDLRDAVKAGMRGVMSGVTVAGGDLADAVGAGAALPVDRVAEVEGHEPEGVAMLAGEIVEAIISEAERSSAGEEETSAIVTIAADAAVTAAYHVGSDYGDRVREEVVRRVSQQKAHRSPKAQRQLLLVADRLSRELPKDKTAWRAAAMVRAFRLLLNAGASDLAASLAYFTILSLFPLVALSIFVFSLVAETETIRAVLDDLVSHYFPASSGLVHDSVGNILDNSATFGVLALAALVFSGNGLFMAANRAVNRVFESDSLATLRGRVVEAIFTGTLGIALLLSIGVSIFVQISLVEEGERIPSMGGLPAVLMLLIGSVSTILPALVTGLVFTVAYHNLSHVHVEWKDAAFGGMLALVLFEVGKHLFIWLSGFAAQRSMVYGSVASSVLLLMWAYMAGIIFLYGAGLARAAGELRPRPVAPLRKGKNTTREEENQS
ncbi:MAG: YihY/virulence factor BrkB family protein [Chloroflexota bacterium]|nr:YihY/virulence factor BrkB family protein [Chloroflexota bacterium]